MSREEKRRRLAVVSWYPADSPTSGERVRLFWVCQALSESFEVHVISFAPAEGDGPRPWMDHRAAGRAMKAYRYRYVDKVLAAIRGRSVHEMVLRGWRRRSFVAEALSVVRPDVVLANQLPAAGLLPRNLKALVVLDTHNAEVGRLTRKSSGAALPLRWAMRQQIVAAAKAEAALVARSDLVLAVSGEDADVFRRAGARRVAVVPNGFPSSGSRAGSRVSPAVPLRLLMLGSLGYSANRRALRDFASEWAPHLPRRWILDVVGPGDPGRSTRRLLSTDSRIRLIGPVEDVQLAYSEHDLLLVPITQGGGTRLKVLEAIGAGLPILSTETGVEGIGLIEDVHYFRAENGHQAAAQIARIAAEPGLARQIATAAKEQTRGMDWTSIGADLRMRVDSLLDEPPTGGRLDAGR